MTISFNKVILIGNLGQDPRLHLTKNSEKIATFSLATDEIWKDKNTGEKKTKTEWHRVVILNDKLSEIAHKYLKKGCKIMVEGQLRTREWLDDKSTNKHYVTEVILTKFRGELIILNGRQDHNYVGGEDFKPIEKSSSKTQFEENPESYISYPLENDYDIWPDHSVDTE